MKGNTSGYTNVKVNNLGGSGAETVNGIEIIQVNGESKGLFIKEGRIVAGAYEYNLVQGNKNWYLSNRIDGDGKPEIPDGGGSEGGNGEEGEEIGNDGGISVIRPEAGSYINNQYIAKNIFNIRLHDRVSEKQYADRSLAKKGSTIWVNNTGNLNHYKSGNDQLKTRNKSYSIQLGGDFLEVSDQNLGSYHLGLMVGHGTASSKTKNKLTQYDSDSYLEGYSIGVYGTYFGDKSKGERGYIDTWIQYNWFKNKVKGEDLNAERYNSRGVSMSLETGWTYLINNSNNDKLALQPQAQIIYNDIKMNKHTETNGTVVRNNQNNNFQTRLGGRIFKLFNGEKNYKLIPFIELNWLHNGKETNILMDNETVKQQNISDIFESKFGVEIQLFKDINIWTDLTSHKGSHQYKATKGTVGIKYNF